MKQKFNISIAAHFVGDSTGCEAGIKRGGIFAACLIVFVDIVGVAVWYIVLIGKA